MVITSNAGANPMKKILLILFVVLALPNTQSVAQKFSNNSLKVSAGVAMNEGKREMGVGTIVSFAYQKSLWKERLRISPYLLTGGFWPFGITDTREQYYRVTTLGINGYLDVIRYKPVSIFIGAGGLVDYSRGLLGTGGWPDEGNTSSEYLFKLYYGGYLGAGLRINKPDSRFAWELMPVNICFGNDYFLLAYFRFGMDIKLN
jgi:opacity protein-like surface antigen